MNDTQPTPPQPQEAPAMPPAPENTPKKKLYNQPWFIILLSVGGLLVLAIPVLLLMFNSGGASSGAADKFYTMIETTAKQTKIRYGYTLHMPEKDGTPPVDVASLSEYDSEKGEFSTAYAFEAIVAGAHRCVKGVEYESKGEDRIADDFKAAEAILKGPYAVNDNKFTAGACEFKKGRYQGDFTDGILAIGLKPGQAKSMADDLRQKNPAKLSDDGKVTYKGKETRKISFEVGKTLTDSPYQSDVFFYSFRDGTSSQVGANVPVSEISKHFDDSFQIPPVGLKGFYLIDEKTNLPVYRYMETVEDGVKVAVAKRTVLGEYSFPDTLTMDETTQLPEIPKL